MNVFQSLSFRLVLILTIIVTDCVSQPFQVNLCYIEEGNSDDESDGQTSDFVKGVCTIHALKEIQRDETFDIQIHYGKSMASLCLKYILF